MIKLFYLFVFFAEVNFCIAQINFDSLYVLNELSIKRNIEKRLNPLKDVVVISKRGSIKIIEPNYNVGGIRFNSEQRILEGTKMATDTHLVNNICCNEETDILDFYDLFTYPVNSDSISFFGLKDSLTYVYISSYVEAWEHLSLDNLFSKDNPLYITSYVDINRYVKNSKLIRSHFIYFSRFDKCKMKVVKVVKIFRYAYKV